MSPEDIQHIIQAIGGDTSSGAMELTLKTVSCLEEIVAASKEDLISFEGARTLLEMLRGAKSELVPIINLLDIFTAGLGPLTQDTLERAMASARTIMEIEEKSPDWIFNQVRDLYAGKEVEVLVYSYSSTVVRVLSRLREVAEVRVVTSEGRPTGDGSHLLSKMDGEGISILYLTDAALMSYVPRVDVAFLGTDGWSPSYFLNKVGTKALVELLDMHGKGGFVFASPLKMSTDEALLSMEMKDYGGEELLRSERTDVRVINRYFEIVPRYPNITLFSHP